MGHRLDVDDLLKLKIKRLKSESEYLQNEMQEIQYVLVTEVMPLWSTEFGKYTKTPEPLQNSVYTFAERADSVGYLGRDGYSLDGIFYHENISVTSNEENQNG